MREAKGKRSLKIGTLLPNIVLYNDPTHPSSMTLSTVISADLTRKPDLLLIFGTSLKVHGIKKLVKDFAKTVHAKKGVVILVNKCEVAKSEWDNVIDYWVEGDCDVWTEDLRARIPNLWMKQEVLPVMPVVKPTPKKRSHENDVSLILVPTVGVMNVEDKENYIPSTPKKTPKKSVAPGAYHAADVLPSPLSPSKRAINVDALESPTKRLRISSPSGMVSPPPKMDLLI